MNTFRDEGALCIYIGELLETGVVGTVGGFGYTQKVFEAIPEMSINQKYPITDAIRTQKIVRVVNNESYLAEYPLMRDVSFSDPWIAGIAVPSYPLGGFAITFSTKLEITDYLKLFFHSIGSLIGFYASRLSSSVLKMERKIKGEIEEPLIPLNDRQLVIAGMLERGFNNAEIGKKLGYSESLIRQETVAIYRKLQVSGRAAMQEINASKLDQKPLK